MSGPFIECDRCSIHVPVASTHMVLNFKDSVRHLCESCTKALVLWVNAHPDWTES